MSKASLDLEAEEGGKDETGLNSENGWGIVKFEQITFQSWVICLCPLAQNTLTVSLYCNMWTYTI